MRVSVITPYFVEATAILDRCRDSVKAQTMPARHYMVSDGYDEQECFHGEIHIAIPHTGDCGDTPRLVGCVVAQRSSDAMMLLDADCWMDPDHVKIMASVDADVVTCYRKLWTPEGEMIGVDPESDGINFTDTNCYLIRRKAFPHLAQWGFRENFGQYTDRMFWASLCMARDAGELTIAHTKATAVNYTTTYAAHYAMLGLHIPPESKRFVILNGEEKFITQAEFIEYQTKGLVTMPEGVTI